MFFVVLAAAPGFAQQLDLPRPSPSAKVTQTVGLTEITVEYSSPAVRGRTIWGQLVPFDQVWRAGANAATKVTFSKDVVVGTTPVHAGSYALFFIPGKESWTAILNQDYNQAGAFNYKKELDIVRVDVKPEPIAMRERLAYLVSDFTNDAAKLCLEWEKVRVSVPLKLDTSAQVAANLKNLDDNGWSPYNAAARWELDQKDYDAAMAYVDKSLAIKEEWPNLWTKAQIFAAKNKYKEAYALAQKADQLGQKNPQRFFMADEVKKAVSEWKGKQ
jgi:hypothetical protein